MDQQALAKYRYRAVREVLGGSPIGEVAERYGTIHPSQVALANRRHTPSSTEVNWARVIATAEGGPVGVRGSELVDRPVVLRAQGILARASRATKISKREGI